MCKEGIEYVSFSTGMLFRSRAASLCVEGLPCVSPQTSHGGVNSLVLSNYSDAFNIFHPFIAT